MTDLTQPPRPTAFGRLIPHTDWEGDDHTPGAHGLYVTCQDTAAAVAVAWASNGRIVHDGAAYRATSGDPNGITLDQSAAEVKRVTGLDVIQPKGWAWGNVSFNLMNGQGLIVVAPYSALPAPDREQTVDNFWHAMFACYRSIQSGVRLYDPLNPDVDGYGRWVPAADFRKFVTAGNFTIGYIKNQPLRMAA